MSLPHVVALLNFPSKILSTSNARPLVADCLSKTKKTVPLRLLEIIVYSLSLVKKGTSRKTGTDCLQNTEKKIKEQELVPSCTGKMSIFHGILNPLPRWFRLRLAGQCDIVFHPFPQLFVTAAPACHFIRIYFQGKRSLSFTRSHGVFSSSLLLPPVVVLQSVLSTHVVPQNTI